MKGDFRQTPANYMLCLFFLLVGSFLSIRFSLWGVEKLQANQVSAAVFCFAFAVGGLWFVILSVFIFNFNKHAFLTLENGRLDAKFGWGKELHTEINYIKHVEIQRNLLRLFVGNTIVDICNLHNAKDLCECIAFQRTKHNDIADMEDAEETYRTSRRSYIAYLVATVIACTCMFINIAWCVLLTEGKDLRDFSGADDVVFISFVVAEICTVLLTCLLVSKCGKKLAVFNFSKLHRISASAFEHKYDNLDRYSNIINKKYFDHNTYRIVVFSPKENIFTYTLERFDIKTRSWVYCDGSARGYAILSELYDDLENSFADVMLED